jgi:hypothetical protein
MLNSSSPNFRARRHRGHHRRGRGFSFAEVMFAVVILGIGFIMVAAIFPVAIQQTQATNDETIGASVAREAINTISTVPQTINNGDNPSRATHPGTLLMFPPTVKNYAMAVAPIPAGVVAPPAIVVPFSGARWEAMKRSVILASDSRYAYVPFYRRENGSDVAQVIVIALQVRNRSTYDPSVDLDFAAGTAQIRSATVNAGAPISATFNPQLGHITINPDSLMVSPFTGPAPLQGDMLSVAPNDTTPNRTRGRTYRLDMQVGPNTYNIDAADSLLQDGGSDGLWGTRPAAPATPDNLDYTPTNIIAAPGAGMNSPSGVAPPTTLQPRVAYAQLFTDPASPAGRIQLFSDPVSFNTPDFAAPGAFVIIADDYPFDPASNGGVYPAAGAYIVWPNIVPAAGAPVGTPQWSLGALNGRIFRLGQLIPADASANPPVAQGTYELDPVYGMRPPQGLQTYSPDTMPNPDLVAAHAGQQLGKLRAKVYMIGRGRTDPTNALGLTAPVEYSGPAQDIAAYTSFIPVQ